MIVDGESIPGEAHFSWDQRGDGQDGKIYDGDSKADCGVVTASVDLENAVLGAHDEDFFRWRGRSFDGQCCMYISIVNLGWRVPGALFYAFCNFILRLQRVGKAFDGFGGLEFCMQLITSALVRLSL
jgi:hypothetical protein